MVSSSKVRQRRRSYSQRLIQLSRNSQHGRVYGGGVVDDGSPVGTLEIGAEGFAVGLDEGLGEELLSSLPSGAVGRDGLIEQNTAIFFGADRSRGAVLDLVVAHAASEVTLVLGRAGAGLESVPEGDKELVWLAGVA